MQIKDLQELDLFKKLDTETIPAIAPLTAGVYIITITDNATGGVLGLYAGKSQDLAFRFNKHIRKLTTPLHQLTQQELDELKHQNLLYVYYRYYNVNYAIYYLKLNTEQHELFIDLATFETMFINTLYCTYEQELIIFNYAINKNVNNNIKHQQELLDYYTTNIKPYMTNN